MSELKEWTDLRDVVVPPLSLLLLQLDGDSSDWTALDTFHQMCHVPETNRNICLTPVTEKLKVGYTLLNTSLSQKYVNNWFYYYYYYCYYYYFGNLWWTFHWLSSGLHTILSSIIIKVHLMAQSDFICSHIMLIPVNEKNNTWKNTWITSFKWHATRMCDKQMTMFTALQIF